MTADVLRLPTSTESTRPGTARRRRAAPGPGRASPGRRPSGPARRAHLDSLTHRQLVDLLATAADADADLARRLDKWSARCNHPTAPPIDLDAHRRAVVDGFDADGGVDGDTVSAWACQAHGIVDRVTELLCGGDAPVVIDLCERAIDCLERAAPEIDDEAGEVADLVSRLSALHLAACQTARPDPHAHR